MNKFSKREVAGISLIGGLLVANMPLILTDTTKFGVVIYLTLATMQILECRRFLRHGGLS